MDSVAADAGAAPSTFLTAGTGPDLTTCLAADTTNIYYTGGSVPIAGGPPVSLGFSFYRFVLRGDFIYGIDEIDDVYQPVVEPNGFVGSARTVFLEQASKIGGTAQLVRTLGVSTGGLAIAVVGDRYFWDESYGSQLSVRAASFDSSSPIVHVLDATVRWTFYFQALPWAVTPAALYWTDGSAIYSRSLSDLP